MNSIGDFLKKYLDFTPPQRVQAKATISIVNELFNTELTEKDVVIRHQKAFISVSGPMKSEILLRKEEILVRIRHLIGDGSIIDVA